MGNGQTDIGGFCRVIYPAGEGASRLEKLRLKRDVSFHVGGTHRRSVPCNLVDELLLRRNRKIHARLRTQIRAEEINIVLNENALNGIPAECLALLLHFLLVRVEPPNSAAHQCQQDNDHNNDLSG